jgi:aspartyl-tRNA(Asn)/glutamyl-tRNA(Gln) amidotransferase subunit A
LNTQPLRADAGPFADASALAQAIAARRTSAAEAVEHCLARIAATQDTLNAYATVAADGARSAAQEIDRRIASGENLGPLAGVPVSVKDILNTAGIRTMWGSRTMAANVPDADAVAVQRLKAAGAIVIGKTTTPEFAYKLLTDSPVTGVTRNPWSLDHTPGGSSGGSAAAVAAGLGPIALATDAGASTRLPAACCSVVGLKPTLGVIPHNQVPDAFNNFIHLGVIARSVADTALALDVMAGPHGADPHSIAVPLPGARAALAQPLDLAGKRVAWRRLLGNTHLDREVEARCREALGALEERGAEIVVVDEPFENVEPTWRVLQQSNWAARFFAKLDEVKDALEPGFVEGIRAGGAYSGPQLLAAIYKRTTIFRAVQAWFARFDFVATPTFAAPPLAIDHRVEQPIVINGENAGDLRVAWAPYLNVFNLTGHPAVSVPAGFTAAGLPVGVQLIAPWYADARLLALARVIEQARPWADRVPPHAPMEAA